MQNRLKFHPTLMMGNTIATYIGVFLFERSIEALYCYESNIYENIRTVRYYRYNRLELLYNTF